MEVPELTCDISVNVTADPAHVLSKLKSASGLAETVRVRGGETASQPREVCTVSLTVKVPATV